MMIMILVGIVCATGLSILICSKWEDSFVVFCFGLFLAIGTGITSLCYCFFIYQLVAAGYQAQIINREYKTSYTREEVFFAGDVIEILRQIDRNRYEMNGNLFQNKGEK